MNVSRFVCVLFVCACCVAEFSYAQQRQFLSNSRLLLGTQSRLSASVRAGDVDGDGDVDLVVANGRHWPQQNILFLNQSRGRFNVARPLGTDLSTSYACEFADFDGDGDLDVAVGNDHAPCLVLTNDGKANFKVRCQVGVPSSVRSLATADIDGDGDIDLLATCRNQPNRIYYNDGDAKFSDSITFGTENDSTIDVAVADLNEDGLMDLILANRDAQPNAILLNAGNRKFTAGDNFGKPTVSSRAVATADFNGDGHVDWVVANIGSQNTVYIGDGNGGVIRKLDVGLAGGQSYCVAVADLNNDDLPDFVVGNQGQINSVFFNHDNAARFSTQTFGNPDSATYGLCTGEFNGDEFTDIAVSNSNQQNSVFLNQPNKRKKQ